MPPEERAVSSRQATISRRAFATVLWCFALWTAGSCSLLLNSDEVQCGADADCARFSNAMCDPVMRLCVARHLTTSSSTVGDGSADLVAAASTTDGGSVPGDGGTQKTPDSQAAVADGGRDGAATQVYSGAECPDLNGNGVLDCKESLVVNPDFRTGLAGWSAELNMRQAFPATDATGNPASGSIAVTNANQSDTATGSTMGGSNQCVPVVGLATYDLYLQTLIAATTDGFTSSGVVLQFYPSIDCSGVLNGSFMPALADENATGWRTLQSIIATPGGTRSLLLRLVVLKPFKQAPTQALFDNVLLKAR